MMKFLFEVRHLLERRRKSKEEHRYDGTNKSSRGRY